MDGLFVFLLIALFVMIIAKALLPGRDPGVGISLLIGAIAQIVVWFGSRWTGLERYGQPWSFFLSIVAAVLLLYAYRETGLDAAMAAREGIAAASSEMSRPASSSSQESLWKRIAMAPAWAALGAVMMGLTGFVIGFFGPMTFQPGANQGPMLGLFITGPGGALLGMLIGGALRIARPEWPSRWRLWVLNAANLAWGLLVLDLVADPRWH